MDIENGQVANNNQMNAKKIGDYVVLLENQLGKGKFGKVFLA